jgi:hypothetical protein
MDQRVYIERLEGLEAAERSNVREGLPPRSTFAREVGQQYARQEISSDDGIRLIIEHHRNLAVRDAVADLDKSATRE